MSIFISYSHQNSEFAINLATQLVQHKTRVWIDKWELNVGDSIVERIQDAIDEASALLVILSKASVESSWCKQELNSGIIRQLDEKRVVVLPVVIEDCRIPTFLRDKKFADFRKNYDEGLQDILEAIAAVTSDSLGRHQGDDLHIDWSIEHGHVKNDFCTDITIVEQAKNQPYTILTMVRVLGNETVTKRYNHLKKADLEWFYSAKIVCDVTQYASDEDVRLLLTDEYKQEERFVVADSNLNAVLFVSVISRRLGSDTGKSILVNIAGQLKVVCDSINKTDRELTPVEQQKMDEIIRRF